MELLKGATQDDGLSLTTDGWTSCTTHSYVTYTAHFMSPDWSLVSTVFQTNMFHGNHTAVKLAKHTQGVLDAFKIPGHSVTSVMHDKAANMVAAGRRLNDDVGCQSHVCVAHRLQTVIRHATDETKGVGCLLSGCRALVGHFNNSTIASEKLAEKQLTLTPEKKPKCLIQDVAQDGIHCSTRSNASWSCAQR